MENDLEENYTITTENQLKTKQAELNDLLRCRAEYMIQLTKHKYYTEGSRPSYLLALTLKQQEASGAIPAIRCARRGVVTSTEEVVKTFKDFYKDLYKNGQTPTENDFSYFFSGLELLTLTSEDILYLESDMTLEELLKALKATNKGKTPGIDGIPVELYLELWDVLGPVWLDTLNYAIERGAFHRDLNTALITVISKPGKDSLECANYRPMTSRYSPRCWLEDLRKP